MSIERLYKLCMIAGSLNCNTLEKQQKFIVKNFQSLYKVVRPMKIMTLVKQQKYFVRTQGGHTRFRLWSTQFAYGLTCEFLFELPSYELAIFNWLSFIVILDLFGSNHSVEGNTMLSFILSFMSFTSGSVCIQARLHQQSDIFAIRTLNHCQINQFRKNNHKVGCRERVNSCLCYYIILHYIT